MMGYIDEDSYQCDFCGFVGRWDASDDVHGDMWGCEKCGRTFCSQCLRNAVGESGYRAIMQESSIILCPDCAKKQ